MRTKKSTQNQVDIITLGCSKNRVDSEVLLTQLKANNINAKHEAYKGNIVVINTCGFIETAKQESIDTILQYAEYKEQNKIEKLYVTGCLSQRYKDDLEKEIPQVDAYFGTLELIPLLETLGANYKHELIGERNLTTPPHYAYVKISEGCNRTCSFCAIPLMRGKHVSKPIETIISEVKNLVKNGVKEIMLIAQELTYYGLDIYKKRMLADLLHQLADIEGLYWIRLHYAYPHQFPLEILDVMAQHKNICNYLDMPLQHASNKVLNDMRRQISQDEIKKLIDTIRNKVPAIALRTTMLVGFPTETEKEFEELIHFVEEQKFERLGVFTYSHEDDTRAMEYEDALSPEEKQERADTLMQVQESIATAHNEKLVGKTMPVLIDRKESNYYVGRTEYDSPEVDNEVLIPSKNTYLRIGDFAPITIKDVQNFDLIGSI